MYEREPRPGFYNDLYQLQLYTSTFDIPVHTCSVPKKGQHATQPLAPLQVASKFSKKRQSGRTKP